MSEQRETDADRAREDEVAARLAAVWHCEFIRNRDQGRLDTLFMRNKALVAAAEIKARLNRRFDTYRTVHLNLQKWFALVQFEMAAGVPTYMVYAFEDGIFYVRAATLQLRQFKLSVRGRCDRPGPDERQPVIEIDGIAWKRLLQQDEETGVQA